MAIIERTYEEIEEQISLLEEVTIVSVTPVGEPETFDLTIEGSHSFAGNGIVVHNTIPKHTKWAKSIRRCYPTPPGYVVVERNYCLPGDSRVLTAAGLKRLDQVTTNDKVIVGGKTLSVLASGKTGTGREALSVKGASGRTLRCTENHRIYVVRGG